MTDNTDAAKTERIHVRVTPKTKKDLETVAEVRGISRSDVLRIMGVEEAAAEAERISKRREADTAA